MFLLMGIFATYCGFIYNDFSSLPVMLSKTCWKMPSEEKVSKALGNGDKAIVAEAVDEECVYPFGLDYTWMRSNEEIVYLNSFKMKTAVMYGVA